MKFCLGFNWDIQNRQDKQKKSQSKPQKKKFYVRPTKDDYSIRKNQEFVFNESSPCDSYKSSLENGIVF